MASLLGTRTRLGAPGLTTRNKDATSFCLEPGLKSSYDVSLDGLLLILQAAKDRDQLGLEELSIPKLLILATRLEAIATRNKKLLVGL